MKGVWVFERIGVLLLCVALSGCARRGAREVHLVERNEAPPRQGCETKAQNALVSCGLHRERHGLGKIGQHTGSSAQRPASREGEARRFFLDDLVE